MTTISDRKHIIDLLSSNIIGCELGVFEGDFSEHLLSSGKFDKLYLVDIFEGAASNFDKTYNDSTILQDIINNKFKEYKNIEIIKSDSIYFLQSMPEKFFDFIYIDTVHSYEHTKKELLESYRVIKNNGFICGHDYCNRFDGVIRAVSEFSENHGYEVIVTKDKPYPSFIIKIIHK